MATSPSERPLSGPSPEELAAIVAAVEMAWPRPVLVADDDVRQSPAWRFSGRWWATPVAARRARPPGGWLR